MIAAAARLLPLAATYLRQIVPPVIATLIAAVLIQGYNRAFSGQLTQPRLAALHADVESAPQAASAESAAGTTRAPATEYITIYERAAPDRLADKDGGREASKDEPRVKAAPLRSAAVAPAAKPARAPRNPAVPVTGSVATTPVTTSIAVAPVAAEPPPVIVAAPPQTYAIAPQGPNEAPVTETPAPPRGALGAIANALSPSALFSRAREFGAKIEQTGNDILPTIRQ